MSGQSSPDSAVFKVIVVGSHDNQVQNEGSLEVTPISLIYTDMQGSKFSWSLAHLRKYGSNGERLFTIETTPECPSGAGVYIFSTPHAPYLESVVAKHLKGSRLSADADELFDGAIPTNGRTIPRSMSLWSLPSNQFPVRSITEDPNVAKEGILEVTGQSIVFVDGVTGRQYSWPIKYLRRYGYDGNKFSFEASERCSGGGGLFGFLSNKASEIKDLIGRQSRSVFGSQMNLNMSPVTPSIRVPLRSVDDDSPIFRRANSFIRRARSAMDLNRNMFDVINISDDLREVGRGSLEVTQADLIYIDHNTEEKWRWPLRYLRRYGCDGNVFSFEAGRRCPGGEGLYAFSCPQASQIHEAIVLSVNGPRKTGNADMFRSNLSLVDPTLAAQRGSESAHQTDSIKLTPPPISRKLPRIPIVTPPRSPPFVDPLTPRGSVSSTSLDDETSSLSSGGTSSPPPKPPRSGARNLNAEKKHLYDNPHHLIQTRPATESPITKPALPPKPTTDSSPTNSSKASKKGKKDKPTPPKKSGFFARKKTGDIIAPKESPPTNTAGVYTVVEENPHPAGMYANVELKAPEHHSMYTNLPRQGSVGCGEVEVFYVPHPHRGDTPPHTPTHDTPDGIIYQNVEKTSSPSVNVYANVELKRRSVPVHTPTQYTEVQIMDRSVSISEGTPKHENRRQSHKLSESSSNNDTGNEDTSVEYISALDYEAMKALENLKRERGKTEQFAEMLKRHTPVPEKSARNKRT